MKLNLKLTHKLLGMITLIVVGSIGALAVISTNKSSAYLEDLARTDLAHLTDMSYEMCAVTAKNTQAKVRSDIAMARELFDKMAPGGVELRDGQLVLLDGMTETVINGETAFVDAIKDKTGAACTVFMKEGQRARRVATSVVDERGNRAVGTYISQPVYDAVFRDGKSFFGRAWVVDGWYVTAYQPIRDAAGNVIGSFFCGVPEGSQSLRESLLAQKIGKTGYIYTMDSKGVLTIHPKSEGKDISNYDFAKEMLARAPSLRDGEIAWIEYKWDRDGVMAKKIVAYTYFKEWDWIIGVGSYLDEFTAPANNIRNAITWIGLVMLLIAVTLAFFFARTIVRPIQELVGVAESVAVGNVSCRVHVRSKDEVGALALAFRKMIDYLQETADAAQRIAQNDLTVTVQPKSEQDLLGNSFRQMINNLTGVIRQLADNARELVSAATEISSSSEQMSRGANEQSAQIEQISTAVEEMSSTILESSRNSNQASEAASTASNTATSGGDTVNETIMGMQKIADVVRESSESIAKLANSADQIGEITEVIDDIADQTNLLALNAAIEAARAGEQGRGFAVVADEVRKLAERSGKATGEITEMIKSIQLETTDAVKSMEAGIQQVDLGRQLADKAGVSLGEIVSVSQRVMDMINQIAAAAEQQSAAAEQISKNIGQIATVTKETASGAEQSATAAEELNRQAEGLQRMVAQFRIRQHEPA